MPTDDAPAPLLDQIIELTLSRLAADGHFSGAHIDKLRALASAGQLSNADAVAAAVSEEHAKHADPGD